MRALLAAALGLIVATAVTAQAATAGSKADVIVFFRTPSRNIGCAYAKLAGEPASLRCDVLSGFKPTPPRPRGCDLDWAYAVVMNKTGRPRHLCAGDTAVDPRARILPYGATWSRDGFRCVSGATGLTCRNLSGHGWFLSRQRSRLF